MKSQGMGQPLSRLRIYRLRSRNKNAGHEPGVLYQSFSCACRAEGLAKTGAERILELLLDLDVVEALDRIRCQRVVTLVAAVTVDG